MKTGEMGPWDFPDCLQNGYSPYSRAETSKDYPEASKKHQLLGSSASAQSTPILLWLIFLAAPTVRARATS